MGKILLDYTFPIEVISPTPAASTAFLKQVCLVCKPKTGEEGDVGELFSCTSMGQVAEHTDNLNAAQLFNAGMAKVFILLADDLDLEAALAEHGPEFFTVLVSDDFSVNEIAGAKASGTVTISTYANLVSGTDDVVTVAGVPFVAQTTSATPGDAAFQAATSNNATADSLAAQINAHVTAKELVSAVALSGVVTITSKLRGVSGNEIALAYTDNDTNVGASVSGALLTGGTAPGSFAGFKGVVGVSMTDKVEAALQAATENRCAFVSGNGNGAKNMCYAFGKLLSNPSQWKNQQYIAMPFNDGINTLGDANSLFASRVSIVIQDDEFGTRLAMFAAGGKAIVAPYILKNLRVDLQSNALQWISGNQPDYTVVNATLLETRLQSDVIDVYINVRKWITAGIIAIEIINDNFVATGEINVSEPKGLWKVENQMQQTL